MLRILPCLLLSGCCCCWPFGDNDGGGYVQDYVGERIGEEIGERIVEAATGAEDVEVGRDGSVTITTAEGTISAREGADGSMVITDGQGNTLATGGEGSTVPDGFPVTGYPGATVASTMDLPDGQLVTWSVNADIDDVLTHVEAQLQALGTVSKGMDMQSEDGRMVMFSVEAANLTAMVSGDGDEVAVVVTLAK